MAELRDATIGDIPWLMEQAKEFAVFYGIKNDFAGNEKYLSEYVERIINDHYFRIVELGNKPVGFMAGYRSGHYLNPDIQVLAELFWWVIKEYRNSGVGKLLLEEFIKYGEDNADMISFTLEDVSPFREEFLISKGFRMKERIFIKEMN